MEQFSKYGPHYLENGFDIIPIKPGLKWPGEALWQSKDYTPYLNKMQYADYGLGIRTTQTPVIDADILNPVLAAQYKLYLERELGSSLVRYGMRPKFAFLCRLDPEQDIFTKTVSATFEDDEGLQHKVEILGHGQQLVADHIHPDTGQPYEWENNASPLYGSASELPIINDSIAAALIAAFEQAAEATGLVRIAEGGASGEARQPFTDRSNALVARQEDSILTGLIENGFEVVQKRPGRYELPRCIWHDMHSKTPGGAFYAVPGTDGNPDPLYYCTHAHCAGKNYRDAAEALGVPVPSRMDLFEMFGRLTQPFTLPLDQDLEEPPMPVIDLPVYPVIEVCEPDVEPDNPFPDELNGGDILDMEVPPRRWIIDGLLPAEEVSMLAAPGGSGKSYLMLQQAVCVASGRAFLGMQVPNPTPVYYISAEDKRETVVERIQRIVHHMMLSPTEYALLRQHLHLWSRDGKDSRILTMAGDRDVITSSDFAGEILERVIARQAGLTMIDPLSMFNGGSENKAEDMNVLIQVFRSYSNITHFRFAHHTNKGALSSGTATNQSAARGSSALTDGVRLQDQLTALSDKELERFGIAEENRRRFVRYYAPKMNYAEGFSDIYLKRVEGGVLEPTTLVPENAVERCNEAVMRELIYLESKKILVGKQTLARDYRNEIGFTVREITASVDLLLDDGRLTVSGTGNQAHLKVTK